MGNDEIRVALCATADDEVKNKTEKALLNAKIAYLLKCEKSRDEEYKQRKVVFYIQQSQEYKARRVIEMLREEARELEIMYEAQ